MRYRNFPFKFHIYNFKYIFDHFGTKGTSLLKRWIDTNYRIIKTYLKIQFLKNCKANNVFRQHIQHITKTLVNILNYKAMHKFKGLISNFKLDLIKIEIFDLYKYTHFLNKELSYLSRTLYHLLPSSVWDSIKKHHLHSFHNFKYTLFLTHYNKFMGLLIKTKKESINNIPTIKYSYHSSKNKFNINKFSTPTNNPCNTESIDITIDPHRFRNKIQDSLDKTNRKWFINLSNSEIPNEVSALLQLGDKFCLPTYLDKKLAIHEFIKDIESNSFFHNINKQIWIRNITIPQLHKFLKNTPPINPLDTKLIQLHKKTKHFCQNNRNIIFTRADKGNVTVAIDRVSYINKVEEILKDNNTYTVVNRNPIKFIENNLNNMLKEWFQKGYISKQQLFKLRSSDSILPKAYGLPKTL